MPYFQWRFHKLPEGWDFLLPGVIDPAGQVGHSDGQASPAGDDRGKRIGKPMGEPWENHP